MKNSNYKKEKFTLDSDLFEPGLQDLMRFKIRKVLFIANLYDFFLIEEDGRLVDLLGNAYKKRDLGYVPIIKQASDGKTALEILERKEFDLVVTRMRLDDMDTFELAQKIKDIRPDIPVVLLAFSTPEMKEIRSRVADSAVDRAFLWQGDGKIIVGIIKYIEDMKNAAYDTKTVGVQNILLIENSIAFYSTYLHVLYDQLWKQIETQLKENLTYTQKKMRQRKRARIHLATSYEEGRKIYDEYRDNLMGIILSDELMREEKFDKTAGIDFARTVREDFKFLPILILSKKNETKTLADELCAGFLNKNSSTLKKDFRKILLNYFYFGDLVFKNSKGSTEAIATNLITLSRIIDSLDAEVLRKYLETRELSRWLKARTEIRLAVDLDKIPVKEIKSSEEIRLRVIETLKISRQMTHHGSIIHYSSDLFREYSRFSLIGSGSIGGKARGLAFIDKVLTSYPGVGEFPDVNITIPKTVVIGTDLFDSFMQENNLYDFAYDETNPEIEIANRFLNCDLPSDAVNELRDLVDFMTMPLAVRSSSLLEDSLYQPFAGVYATKMLPNDNESSKIRLKELEAAVKLVYASTFFPQAKSYINNTPNRIEDEKMAVIIQEVIGTTHSNRFYPDFSGVARSYNYYPVGKAEPEDGVVNIALGLGKTVAEGGVSISFTPKYPKVLAGLNSVEEILNNTQKSFWGIRLRKQIWADVANEDQYLEKIDLQTAEEDGILLYAASTYSHENNAIYDGTSRAGPRIVTFAQILKNDVMPLAGILQMLLWLGQKSMGCPVEIEFAVTLGDDRPLPATFGLLQVKPLVGADDSVEVEIGDFPKEKILCKSDMILGNGIIDEIRDIVFIDPEAFEPSKNAAIAEELTRLNNDLSSRETKYILIGPGRWGSSEPWLGIPVNWGQIDGAKIIVEASLPNMNPDASQGSHFFQNITSLGVGYFTVRLNREDAFINWDWLTAKSISSETKYVKHLRLSAPLKILMDGRHSKGMILIED